MSRGNKNNKGGRPKGSKSPHTIEVAKMREYVIKRVALELNPILSAQIDSAKGLHYVGEQGRVYTAKPDLKAGEYLMNQGIGRPTEHVELSGRDGKPLIIRLDE